MTLVIQICFVVAQAVAKRGRILDCDGAMNAIARECAGIMPSLLGGKVCKMLNNAVEWDGRREAP
jgi:hypothetical protein